MRIYCYFVVAWHEKTKYKSQNLPNRKQMETQYELCVLNEIIFLEAKFFSSGKHEKMFSNSRRNIRFAFVLCHPNEQTKTNLILKFRDQIYLVFKLNQILCAFSWQKLMPVFYRIIILSLPPTMKWRAIIYVERHFMM